MLDLEPQRRAKFPGGTVLVYPRADAELVASDWIASAIGAAIDDRGQAVVGLATGSTPIPVYEHLVSLRTSGKLPFDFKSVITYNLDEYYPMSPTDPNSYRAFMDKHLFRRVGLAANRTHVLDGTVPEAYTQHHASDFDRWIAADGGLDLQLLGLGRNGHIGFNEPSDLTVEVALALPTRLVELHPTTRSDAIKDFGTEFDVPRRALTMGIASILAARSILVLAFGSNKADAVAESLMGTMTARMPGSLLQSVARKVTWLVDAESAAKLF